MPDSLDSAILDCLAVSEGSMDSNGLLAAWCRWSRSTARTRVAVARCSSPYSDWLTQTPVQAGQRISLPSAVRELRARSLIDRYQYEPIAAAVIASQSARGFYGYGALDDESAAVAVDSHW